MWKEITVIIFLRLLQGINAQEQDANIENMLVSCIMDITTFIPKTHCKMEIKNLGAKPLRQYLFHLKDDEHHIVFSNDGNVTLQYEVGQYNNDTIYKVELDETVRQFDSYVLRVSILYPRKLIRGTPYVKLGEAHTFIWRGNHLFYSRYYTKKYRYVFMTSKKYNANVELSRNYTHVLENSYYFLLKDIKPFSYEELDVRFATLSPNFIVRTLDRRIYVSHFGKTTIEDEVLVENAGPPLKGHFHRTQDIYWMYTHLHPAAENIQFYDNVGNISKSSLFDQFGARTIKFIPRYSLLQGGWKAGYTIAYQVATYIYVAKDDQFYYLKMRAVDHILNDVTIEDAEVRIVLPDGASFVSIEIPPGFDKDKGTVKTFTSLSHFGRETVVLRGKLLLEFHINDFLIKYRYSRLNYLRAPVHIMIMIELGFLSVIFLRRASEYFVLNAN